MKRYTLGLVVGTIALGSFIMYKTPTMTAPATTNPPVTTAPTGPVTTLPVKPVLTPPLKALTINVQNEADKDITVKGTYTSTIVTEGKAATQSTTETRNVPKKSTAKVTFEPKSGYDRLEIGFEGSSVRSVNIIHSAVAPASEQTVTIK